MEDKKTILAFVIIGLLLLLMPKYYEWMGLSPTEDSDSSSQREDSVITPTTAEEYDESHNEPSKRSRSNAQSTIPHNIMSVQKDSWITASPFDPQQIVIRTPLQHLVISSEGGVIVSCQLLRYYKVDGQFVELIPPGGHGLALSLKHLDSIYDLAKFEFIPDRNRLEITNREAVLRLVANLGDTKRIQKIFTFYPNRYAFDLQIIYQ